MLHRIACLLILAVSTSAYGDRFDVTIVSTDNEKRQSGSQSFAGITVRPQRPVLRAVELALHESQTIFNTLSIQHRLHELRLKRGSDIQLQLQSIDAAGLVILDLPFEMIEQVARLLDERNIVTFNVRHSDTRLRDTLCLDNLFHTIPSDRMYFDALGQFLIHRGWRKVLLVQGPTERDSIRAKALLVSLEKFGASVVDHRTFTLSHHPDDRDSNRPGFLTGGVSYDVVAVIDTARDYGRYLQYSTRSARPVVGDVGLMPTSWHYALERYGAPQLNERYRHFKNDRQVGAQTAMTDAEFAAWSAVKLVTNSINTRPGAELNLRSLLNDPATQVDLYKGTRGSIRHWNNQLRQPVLLSTADAVIAVAPMPKFLHPKHYVDTLGLDEPESDCRLR